MMVDKHLSTIIVLIIGYNTSKAIINNALVIAGISSICSKIVYYWFDDIIAYDG